MKNAILALVFLVLLVGAAFAVTRTKSVANVEVFTGVNGAKATECNMEKSSCATKKASKSSCDKGAGVKKSCPSAAGASL